ncbi:serine kinase [Pararhizobium arenae]|uniref:serine kinase n=1 Tax=Pararhizobium arenae TaxID=1856850 RepID=UPI00094B092F
MTRQNAVNVHATAIVLGSRGLLFVGPSGCGKSSTALSCLLTAADKGRFSALVADDQVFVSSINGRLVARRPASIANIAELRGGGIVTLPSLCSAVIDCAVLPVRSPDTERLPPLNETYLLPDGATLPLVRLPLLTGLQAYDALRLVLPRNLMI